MMTPMRETQLSNPFPPARCAFLGNRRSLARALFDEANEFFKLVSSSFRKRLVEPFKLNLKGMAKGFLDNPGDRLLV